MTFFPIALMVFGGGLVFLALIFAVIYRVTGGKNQRFELESELFLLVGLLVLLAGFILQVLTATKGG